MSECEFVFVCVCVFVCVFVCGFVYIFCIRVSVSLCLSS